VSCGYAALSDVCSVDDGEETQPDLPNLNRKAKMDKQVTIQHFALGLAN